MLFLHFRMNKGDQLSEKELVEYWENFTGLDSDDGADSDSESLEDPVEDAVRSIQDDVEDVSEAELSERDGPTLSDDEENLPLSTVRLGLLGDQANIERAATIYRDILWKEKSLQLNEDQLRFTGDQTLDENLCKLETPYEFFRVFFSNDLIKEIVQETNLYAVQKKPERPPVFTEMDIKQYIGIIIYISMVHMPNTRSYWSEELRFAPIADVMPINKFEKIRQYIHFNDNHTFIPRDQPNHDRLHKIRPLVTHLNEKFQSITLEQHLSIDEQMCSTKVRHYMKQYMPMKPHKWGFKFFVLAGVSGFAYKFEIYTGQEKFEKLVDGEPDLGITSSIVLRLARVIPRHKNYILYHDNYYTALKLMVHLAKEGIYSLGTIRRNRLPNCKLPTEASLKKAARGISHEYVATVDGVDIASIIWKDNKYVTLISSFVGKKPLTNVKRFDRKEKKSIEVECPNIISEYNKHMGGVDLLDSMMGRYKIRLKSRKWYIRLFYHLVDMSLVNSWLLYKRIKNDKGEAGKILNQAEFRTQVAYHLCNLTSSQRKRGRPSSSLETEIAEKRKKGPIKHIPPKEVRTDQTSHWPVHQDAKMRCKYPNCKGFTRIKCEKCGLELCLNKNNNCFKNFHN